MSETFARMTYNVAFLKEDLAHNERLSLIFTKGGAFFFISSHLQNEHVSEKQPGNSFLNM